jgi:hypothetical protein
MSEKLRKKSESAAEHSEQVLEAAEAVKTSSERGMMKIIPLRVPEKDYLSLRAFFAGRGLALATGARMSVYHVISEIERGTLKIDAGGIRLVTK